MSHPLPDNFLSAIARTMTAANFTPTAYEDGRIDGVRPRPLLPEGEIVGAWSSHKADGSIEHTAMIVSGIPGDPDNSYYLCVADREGDYAHFDLQLVLPWTRDMQHALHIDALVTAKVAMKYVVAIQQFLGE